MKRAFPKKSPQGVAPVLEVKGNHSQPPTDLPGTLQVVIILHEGTISLCSSQLTEAAALLTASTLPSPKTSVRDHRAPARLPRVPVLPELQFHPRVGVAALQERL